MKIIFLDIDGVLMGTDGVAEAPDPARVARLNGLAERTGAQLVVSSTWRSQGLEALTALLREWGVTAPVAGMTDDLGWLDFTTPIGLHRGDEIGQWLDEHPGVEDFVILDDDDDMGGLLPFLVQVGADGLTDDLAAAAETALKTPGP